MLSKRKKKILQAIVDEYIGTAEPVSSGTLTKNHGLDFSSATIRNEMADLEKEGYLDKPHTSSGRVPSSKGYRLYVDEMLNEENISLDEVKYIKSKLQSKVDEIEELTKIATNTLSEITHYTAVAIGPKSNLQIIEEIKFVSLGDRMLMVVILTDTGLIREAIIKFDEDIREEQIQTLSNIFNTKLKGKPLERIDTTIEQYIFSEIKYSIKVIKHIIAQINKIIEEETKLYLEGTKKSFDLPEFNSLQTAKKFVNVLDQKDLVLNLLESDFEKDVNVYIGEELDSEDLKDFSIITFKHKVNDKDMGTIGLIGPKRMDYAKVISVMKYIKKLMEEGGE